MLLNNIVKNINKLVANSSSFQLPYSKLELYINGAVDYINEQLKVTYPTPLEYWLENEHDFLILLNNKFKGALYTLPTTANDKDMLRYIPDDQFYVYNYENSGAWKQHFPTKEEVIEYSGDNVPTMTGKTNQREYDYSIMPEYIIRDVLIYYAAASYLEEEDEFENQYRQYMARAEQRLDEIRKRYFSCYDCNW